MLTVSSIFHFLNVPGLDWGGVRREWFELISSELFDPTNTPLFRRFKDDMQGLVSLSSTCIIGYCIILWALDVSPMS